MPFLLNHLISQGGADLRLSFLSGDSSFEYLAEPVRSILRESGIREPTPPQAMASPAILRGDNVLVIAPTGSGKTEAAILPLLSRIVGQKQREGISLLYVTPLRALNRDMLRRLEVWCSKLGLSIDVRHGDTPASQRRKQSKTPPDLLVTTPETLQAILPGRKMRENLRMLKAIVIDEVHNLIESKRGVQLAVGLQRLRKVAGEFQLIGLSATVGSPELAGKFLFGDREHQIVRVDFQKDFKFGIEYPTPDTVDSELAEKTFATPDLAARLSRITSLLESHTSTLIFVNSRTVAEMLGEKLGRLRKDVGVHHGSLPREERERVELAFKKGETKALVCTSTLELGIDVGTVDLVVQYMSPRQVTSLIQRVGRSGHRIGRTSEGIIIAVSADDVLESSASISEAKLGRLEPTRMYRESLDVLAHQVAGYLMDSEMMDEQELIGELRKTYAYSNLSEEKFRRVVKYLEELRKLRVEGRVLRRTGNTREYYFENLSMIPDETRYLVIDVATNQTVGILGEEFILLRARVGVHFILKGKIWQIEKVSDDRKVYVTPVDDPLAAVPVWDGEMIPVPYGLALRTGLLRRRIGEVIDAQGVENAALILKEEVPAPARAIQSVVEEIDEQKRMGVPIPSDKLILFEGFQKYLIVHSCFGEAVNRTLGYVLEELLSRRGLIRVWFMDGYRMLLELTSDASEIDLKAVSDQLFGLSPEELEKTYFVAVKRNFPFPGRVKTIAERFGALKRGRYISHPNLCSLPTRFENTPIFEEALQETGRDLVDIEGTKQLLTQVARGSLKVDVFYSKDRPSPIAYHILYRYLDVPEAVAPDSLAKTSAQRMKVSIFGTSVQLVCVKCGRVHPPTRVGEVAEEPLCQECRSSLLAPCFWNPRQVELLVRKRLGSNELTKEEREELAKARRAADLVLSYGKRAVIALSVYGIGPQTAARILARMHAEEGEFYRDILEAKLRFVTTRPYWESR